MKEIILYLPICYLLFNGLCCRGYVLPPLFDDLGSAYFMLISLSQVTSVCEWKSEERLELSKWMPSVYLRMEWDSLWRGYKEKTIKLRSGQGVKYTRAAHSVKKRLRNHDISLHLNVSFYFSPLILVRCSFSQLMASLAHIRNLNFIFDTSFSASTLKLSTDPISFYTIIYFKSILLPPMITWL